MPNSLHEWMRRILEGPTKPRRQDIIPQLAPKSCRVLHETASAEIEAYGQIMSGSILVHMKECGIDYKNIAYEFRTEVDNCLHDYKEVACQLDGTRILCCEYCGDTKYVKYRVMPPAMMPPIPLEQPSFEKE